MEAKAVAKYVRIAPRKLRIVINLIRGKSVGEAFAILKYTPKVGSEVIEKVLRSAVAPTMKRIHPRSRGQAFKILKRSSHVTVAVKEK